MGHDENPTEPHGFLLAPHPTKMNHKFVFCFFSRLTMKSQMMFDVCVVPVLTDLVEPSHKPAQIQVPQFDLTPAVQSNEDLCSQPSVESGLSPYPTGPGPT